MTEKFLSIILKEKKLILSCILASFVLFLTYAIFIYKPSYKTDAKVFIRNIPQYNVDTGNETGDNIVSSQSGYSNPLFNIIQILQSESLSNKVYKTVSLKNPKEFEKTNIKSSREFYSYFKNQLKTKIIPSTDTLTLSLNWANEKSADYVLLETINQFKNENLELRRSVETKQSKYLDEYSKEIENKLATVREQIRDYRLSKNVINAEEESGQVLLTRYELEKQIADLKSQIHYNDRKLANFSKALGFSDAKSALRATAIGEDRHLESLRNDLSVAQQKYANLTGKYNDAYPEVVAVKNEIKAINSNINGRTQETLQDVSIKRGLYDRPSQDIVIDMARTQAETSSLRAQLSSLIGTMNTLKNDESELPNKILNLEKLKNQEATLNNIYESFKRKQLDAKFKENGIVDNVFILDYPSKPKRNNNDLLLSFLGFIYTGALAGVLGGWIKENPESLSFRSYKSIGILPFIKNSEYFKAEYSENGLTRSTESPHGASYANIALNLMKLSIAKGAKFISFVSSSPHRTSSFITPNIAANLAKLGKSVVFISSDFKCSNKIKEQFNIKSEVDNDLIDIIRSINCEISLSKYISSNHIKMLFRKNALRIKFDTINDNHFDFLPVSNQNQNLYDYVLSIGFDEFINFLKANYDFVLIDMPAQPATYPVCSSLMQKTDLNIMIANSSDSSESTANIINELKDFNLDIPYVISRDSDGKDYKIIEKSQLYANTEN